MRTLGDRWTQGIFLWIFGGAIGALCSIGDLMLFEKSTDKSRDLINLLIEREVTRVKNTDFRVGYILDEDGKLCKSSNVGACVGPAARQKMLNPSIDTV